MPLPTALQAKRRLLIEVDELHYYPQQNKAISHRQVKMIPHMTEVMMFWGDVFGCFWGCFTPVYQVSCTDGNPVAFSAFGIVNHLLLCRPPKQARNNLPLNSTPANLRRVGALYEGQERLQQETDAKVRAVA